MACSDHLRREGAATDVVEPAVVGLTDDHVDGNDVLIAGLGQHPVQDGIGRARHGQRIGQHDGRLDLAQFDDLGRSHQLAVAVAHGNAGRRLVLEDVSAVGQDGGGPGANVEPFDQREVADAQIGYVGDGVEPARRKDAGRHAQVAQPRSGQFTRRRVLSCSHRLALSILFVNFSTSIASISLATFDLFWQQAAFSYSKDNVSVANVFEHSLKFPNGLSILGVHIHG